MAGDIAPRDQNFVPVIQATSYVDGVSPVNIWADPSTHRLYCDVVISSAVVAGAKSNNAVVPGSTNLGVLPAVATAAAPSYTEGFQVGLSTDLAGALRVTGSLSVGGTTDNSAYTAGTSTGTPAFGFYHSTIDAVTDGRSAALAIDAKRNLFTVIRDAAGNARGANVDANNNMGVVLPAETTKVLGTVRVVGNIGAIFDGPTGSAVPANVIYMGVSDGTNLRGVVQAVNALDSTGTGIPTAQMVGQFDDTSPGTVTENRFGNIRMSVRREMYQQIRDAAGNERGLNVDANGEIGIGAIRTSVTPGTAAGNLGKAEDAVHGSGDTGVFMLAVANEAQTSLAADGDYIAHGVDTKGNTMGVGNIAHDGVDAGAPLKIGGKATNVEPTAVSASGDRANLITDLVGKLIVLPYANPENFVSGAITSAMTGTTSTSLIAAPASGLRNYITQITVSNSHATVGTDVIIQDGNGGTTLYTIPAAAVYGGATLSFPVPLRQPTTATAIYCANVTTGASTKVSASGYKGV